MERRQPIFSVPNQFLLRLLQPERRLHLRETLYEMAITSGAHYFLIGCTAVLAVVLFPGHRAFDPRLALAASGAAVVTGILFWLFRHRLPLLVAVSHSFLALLLVGCGLVASNTPDVAASVSMMFILTSLHAFHFFCISASLALVVLIGILFYLAVGLHQAGNWPFTLTLLLGCCLTAGIVVQLMVRRIHHLATTDKLTGVYNRHTWDALFHQKLESARLRHRPLFLMLIDLDRFKQINDTKGHQEGDRILRLTAEKIRDVLADNGVVARWGGDEFILLLEDVSMDQVLQTEKTLRKALQGTTEFTCGIAGLRDNDSADTLLSRADARLLAGKRYQGRRATDRVAAT